MGEQKLRFKNSQQTTDEGNEPDVPVDIAQAYECIRQPCDSQIADGTTVRLLDMKDEILVFHGTQPIGYVAPGQDEVLRADVGLPDRVRAHHHVLRISEILFSQFGPVQAWFRSKVQFSSVIAAN
jgi:hypothetical protein